MAERRSGFTQLFAWPMILCKSAQRSCKDLRNLFAVHGFLWDPKSQTTCHRERSAAISRRSHSFLVHHGFPCKRSRLIPDGHCERLYGARQSVLLLFLLRSTGRTDSRSRRKRLLRNDTYSSVIFARKSVMNRFFAGSRRVAAARRSESRDDRTEKPV